MKEIKLLTLSLLLFSSFAFAQSNYRPGLAVTTKGDTLRGYIDVMAWEYNPEHILFKESLSANSRKLGPGDITYFMVNGYMAYRKYTVSISLNPIDISSPAAQSDTSRTTATVFLKIAQDGINVTLFSYRDKLKQRFYIKDKIMPVPDELVYGIYQTADDNGGYDASNIYRNQLSELCNKYQPDNDKLIARIEQASYNETDLATVAALLNGSSMQQAKAMFNRQQSAGIRIFAGAGLNSNTIKAGQYYSSPSSTSIAPVLTAGIDLVPAPIVGRLVFRLGLAYTINSYNFTNNSDPIYNISNPVDYKVHVKQNILLITPQVIYNIYNTEKLKIFADVGYSLNELSYAQNAVTAYQGGKMITSPSEGNNFDSKGEYSSFLFKAGVLIDKKFEISANYYPSADLSNSLNYTNDQTGYQLIFSYIFQ